jgi:ABC-type nitrate/sulfonate/bicarbonate transport system substrate-binding protein
MQGCVVVRTEFLEQNLKAVENFLADYKASILKAQEDHATTAAL